MAEALMAIVDQIGDDAFKSVRRPKAGHVIVVMPDGHDWSNEERTNPNWRIVSFPGVAVSQLDALVTSEREQRIVDKGVNEDGIPLDPLANHHTNPMLNWRAWTLDLASLPVAHRNALSAPRKGTGILTIPKAAIDAVKKRIPATPNPNVIG